MFSRSQFSHLLIASVIGLSLSASYVNAQSDSNATTRNSQRAENVATNVLRQPGQNQIRHTKVGKLLFSDTATKKDFRQQVKRGTRTPTEPALNLVNSNRQAPLNRLQPKPMTVPTQAKPIPKPRRRIVRMRLTDQPQSDNWLVNPPAQRVITSEQSYYGNSVSSQVQSTSYLEPTPQDLHDPFGGSDTLKHPFGEVPAEKTPFQYQRGDPNPFQGLPRQRGDRQLTGSNFEGGPEFLRPTETVRAKSTPPSDPPLSDLHALDPQNQTELNSEGPSEWAREIVPRNQRNFRDKSKFVGEIPAEPETNPSSNFGTPELGSEQTSSGGPELNPPSVNQSDISSIPSGFPGYQSEIPAVPSAGPESTLSGKEKNNWKKTRPGLEQILESQQSEEAASRIPGQSVGFGKLDRNRDYADPSQQEDETVNPPPSQIQQNETAAESRNVPQEQPAEPKIQKPDPFRDPPNAKPVIEYDKPAPQEIAPLKTGRKSLELELPNAGGAVPNRQGQDLHSQHPYHSEAPPIPFESHEYLDPAVEMKGLTPEAHYPNQALEAYQPYMAPQEILKTYDGILARDGNRVLNCDSCEPFRASQCSEGLFYFSVFSGPSSPSNFASFDQLGNQLDFDLDTGYGLGLAVGRTQGVNLRTEFELSFRDHSIDSVLFNQLGSSRLIDLDGGLTTYSGMANAYWEFVRFRRCRVKPYVGAGLGFAAFNASVPSATVTSFDESSLAYQFMAGLNFKLGANTDFFTEYRYFNADGLSVLSDLSSIGGPSASHGKYDFSSQDVFFGLRFKF